MNSLTINNANPEKEFILCKNVSGGTLSAGAAVYFDTATATDGYAISGARTGQKFLFAGINEKALTTGSKGMIQTYGIASAYVLVTTSMVAGDQLDAVTSATHLANFIPVSATSLVPTVANPWNFVATMSAVTSGISTAVLKPVFIRAR